MPVASGFRELRVYQGAFAAASEIFRLTKQFPPEERFSLTDQIRRSSRSVCANIAEAWLKRRYIASFVSKLTDADAEAAETQVWLDTALSCGYLNAEAHQQVIARYQHIGAQIGRMIANADHWCYGSEAGTHTSHSVREISSEYEFDERDDLPTDPLTH